MAKDLKILYVGTHLILEHDELKIFGELGYKYLSLGAYYSPYGDESTGDMRPPLPPEQNLWDRLKGDYRHDRLTKKQVDPFDWIYNQYP